MDGMTSAASVARLELLESFTFPGTATEPREQLPRHGCPRVRRPQVLDTVPKHKTEAELQEPAYQSFGLAYAGVGRNSAGKCKLASKSNLTVQDLEL